MSSYQIAKFDSHHINQPCQHVDYRSSKKQAIDTAQSWVSYPGRSASIIHHSAVIMRYWRDGDGLQYISYK
jgi:hypothetical protein